jgi:hypothetical protein
MSREFFLGASGTPQQPIIVKNVNCQCVELSWNQRNSVSE